MFLIALVLCCPQQPGLPSLEVAVVVKGGIESGDTEVQSPALAGQAFGPVRHRSYRVRIDKAGSHFIDLESHFFDAYLVVRRGGEVLVEDDDGGIGTHARAVLGDLRAGDELQVDVCAKNGGTGEFRVRMRQGPPPAPPEGVQLLLAELRDLQATHQARARVLGASAEPTLVAAHTLGEKWLQVGEYQRALDVLRPALAHLQAEDREPSMLELAVTGSVAAALRRLGQLQEAEPLYRRAIELSAEVHGSDTVETATRYDNYSLALAAMGRNREALDQSTRALEVFERVQGPRGKDVAICRINRSQVLRAMRQFGEAERNLREAIEAMADGAEVHLAIAHDNLAQILSDQQRHEEGLEHNTLALELFARHVPPEHPYQFEAQNIRAYLLLNLGREEDARQTLAQQLQLMEQLGMQDVPIHGQTEHNLGLVLGRQMRFAEARDLFEAAVARRERQRGADPRELAAALLDLVDAYDGLDDAGKARATLARARQVLQDAGLQGCPEWAMVLAEGVAADRGPGSMLRAVATLAEAVRILEGSPEAEPRLLVQVLMQQARTLGALNRAAEGHLLAKRAVELAVAQRSPEHPECLQPLLVLSQMAFQLDRSEEGQSVLQQALDIAVRSYGKDHPSTAAVEVEMAAMLRHRTRYAEARALAEHAAAVLGATFGADSTHVLTATMELANADLALGRFEQAAGHVEHAFAIAGRQPQDANTRIILHGLRGNLREELGDLDGALQDARLAVDVAIAEHGEDSAWAGLEQDQVCSLLARRGDHGEALAVGRSAVQRLERHLGPGHPRTLTAVNNLAVACIGAGAHDEAERLLARWAAASTADSAETRSLALHNRAMLHSVRGESELAIAGYRESLRLLVDTYGPRHPDTPLTRSQLAVELIQVGEYEPGLQEARQALEDSRALYGDLGPMTLWMRNNLGSAYTRVGRLEDAYATLRANQEAKVRALGSESPSTLLGAGNLAIAAVGLGRLDEAAAMIAAARADAERVLPGPHEVKAQLAYVQGTLAARRDDFAAAERHLQEALEMRRHLHGDLHDYVLSTRRRLAEVATMRGHFAAAESGLDGVLAALDALGLPADNFLRLRHLVTKAWVRQKAGNPAGALQVATDAIGIAVRRLDRLTWGTPESDRQAIKESLQAGLDLVLSGTGCSEADAARAHAAVLAWKGLLLRATQQSQRALYRGLGEEARQLLDEVRGLQVQIARTLHSDVADRRARLEGLQLQRQAAEAKLWQQLGGRDRKPGVDAVQVAKHLPEAAALVDFLLFTRIHPAAERQPDREELVAFVLHRDAPVRRVDLGDATPIRRAVADHLASIGVRNPEDRGRDPGPGTDEPGARVRRLLWEPLAAAVGDATLVYVAPDGFLGQYPLGVVPLAKRFLLEERDFVYTTDAMALVGAPPAAHGPGSLLAVGGLRYDPPRDRPQEVALRGGPGQRWEYLTYTLREAAGVEAQHEQVFGDKVARRLLRHWDAPEELLKSVLGQSDYLHIATHGYYRPRGDNTHWDDLLADTQSHADAMATQLLRELPGLTAGLVCSNANAPQAAAGEDGRLTAEEIGWLDLTRVRLAFVPSCESGIGPVRPGEGMLGLRQAFHRAGVRTVLSTLWEVPDEDTARLVAGFYVRLWADGVPPREALRAAQLEVLRQNREQSDRPNPRSWAGIVLSTTTL